MQFTIALLYALANHRNYFQDCRTPGMDPRFRYGHQFPHCRAKRIFYKMPTYAQESHEVMCWSQFSV